MKALQFFFIVFILQISGLCAFHTAEPTVLHKDKLSMHLLKSTPPRYDPFDIYDDDIDNIFDETNNIREIRIGTKELLYSADITTDTPQDQQTLESWSVVWYIASFGGLITFFLVVSCSEWCCRRSARRNCQRSSNDSSNHVISDSPPPSYDQFAPPSYESLCYGKNGEKSEFDVYVVPVEAFGPMMSSSTQMEDQPPSYMSANERQIIPAYPKEILRVPIHSELSRIKKKSISESVSVPINESSSSTDTNASLGT